MLAIAILVVLSTADPCHSRPSFFPEQRLCSSVPFFLTPPQTAPQITTNTTKPISESDIECIENRPDFTYTDVDGCRPTLNLFRQFPMYGVKQRFKEGRFPREPVQWAPPPTVVYMPPANCAVYLSAIGLPVEDKFSWRDIRAAATEILEECKDWGGKGGSSAVGAGIGWRVTVTGVEGVN